jgi:hypothetical protein
MAEAGGEGSLLLPHGRRQAIYLDWLRNSVKKADEIIAEMEGREG